VPERVYMNRIPGEERIHVEILAADIPLLLEDLEETSLGVNAPTAALVQLLREAQARFVWDARMGRKAATAPVPEGGQHA